MECHGEPVCLIDFVGSTKRFVKEGAEALVTTDTTPPMTGVVGFVSPEAEFTPKTVQTQDLRTVLVYEVRLTVEDPNWVSDTQTRTHFGVVTATS